MTHAPFEAPVGTQAVDANDGVPRLKIDAGRCRQTLAISRRARPGQAGSDRAIATEEPTAAIAHEVGQPLTALLLHAEAGLRWLNRPTPVLEEVRQSLEAILSEGRRANEILKLIRASLARAPLRRETLTIPALVESAIAISRPAITSAEVDLHLDLGPTLPTIRGNAVQLQQLLVNLILNATQAMSGQKTCRRLTVSACQPDPDTLAIAVSDTGPGIAPESAECVFAPFFTTKRDGMGMGLAICRMAAEAHGGRIAVESLPGAGATFQLLLPLWAKAGSV